MESRGSLHPLYAIAGRAVRAIAWKTGSITVGAHHGPGGIAARRSGVVHRFVSRPPGYALHNRPTGHHGPKPPLGRLKPVSAASRPPVIRWIEPPDCVAPPLCLCWSLYRVGLPLRAHYSHNPRVARLGGCRFGVAVASVRRLLADGALAALHFAASTFARISSTKFTMTSRRFLPSSSARRMTRRRPSGAKTAFLN